MPPETPGSAGQDRVTDSAARWCGQHDLHLPHPWSGMDGMDWWCGGDYRRRLLSRLRGTR